MIYFELLYTRFIMNFMENDYKFAANIYEKECVYEKAKNSDDWWRLCWTCYT